MRWSSPSDVRVSKWKKSLSEIPIQTSKLRLAEVIFWRASDRRKVSLAVESAPGSLCYRAGGSGSSLSSGARPGGEEEVGGSRESAAPPSFEGGGGSFWGIGGQRRSW